MKKIIHYYAGARFDTSYLLTKGVDIIAEALIDLGVASRDSDGSLNIHNDVSVIIEAIKE